MKFNGPMSNRAIVIVMDGCGAGEAPDAASFGDLDHPSTIRHVWDKVGGFHAPNLRDVGFLAACGIEPLKRPKGRYGRLRELSQGKDSVTGHWEMMGIVTPRPFPTYPSGFPAALISDFEKAIDRKIIGNKAASGTEIIRELGSEHVSTGSPIVYTSADSVFQIACHEAVVPIEELYRFCQVARELCVAPNDVQRVIARPFEGDETSGFRRTERRKDFPLEAGPNLLDEIGDVYGVGVVPELFNGRGFRKTARTQSNSEHAVALWTALESDARFVFANFEDFDMLFGHRNDPQGFAGALEAFDVILGKLMGRLGSGDLLVLTADHGNDPTTASTDHSREYVPAVIFGEGVNKGYFGDVDGMNAIGATVAAHLGVAWEKGVNLASTQAL
jgi:phosphopentomutase